MADIEVTAKIDATQMAKGAKQIKSEVKGVADATEAAERRLERGRATMRRRMERQMSRDGTGPYARRGPSSSGGGGGRGSSRGGGGGRSRGGRGSQGGRGRSGGMAMGVLEASRGIEDFAVAGMRGALNNVPGTLMSFGAGAGLAGGAQIALVAVNELIKGLEVLMDKSRELNETQMFTGIGVLDSAKFQREYMDEALEKAKELEQVFARMNAIGDLRRGHLLGNISVEDSDRAVKQAKEIFSMRASGATEEQLIVRQMQHQNALLDEKVRQEERLAQFRKLTRKDLQEQRDAQQAIVDKSPAETIAYINRELRATAISTGAGTGGLKGAQGNKIVAQRRAALIEGNFGSEAKYIAAEKDVAVAKQKLKLLDEQLTKNYELIEQDEWRGRWLRKNTENNKTLNRIQGAQKVKDLRNGATKDPLFNVLGAHSINTGSGMLSSLGSVGMGANEATNAMNLQKQQVSLLKKINDTLNKKLFRPTYV